MSTITKPTPVTDHSPPMTTLRVYNTLSRTKEEFQPIVPGKVGIYLCGPTVYKPSHIGHMVGPVIFDTIKRYLVYCGYDVTWVVNITDVDDKLIDQANERNLPMATVAEEMTADYLHNLAAMGVDTIDKMPRATEHMHDIISFIENLITKGFAYESEGDVYFEVSKDPEYGKLTNRTTDSLQGEGGDAASRKRSLGDFALWKSSKPGEPSWESPWGEGRPGWHIECSAMCRSILGETFDIHGGGLDLTFPHHENEIAQSECCHGKPMATYWMHNGLMRAAAAGKVGGRAEREEQATAATKISKSNQASEPAAEPAEEQATVDTKISRSKGAGGLADLIARQGGQQIRFFLLRTHYRSTIVFSEEGIEEAARGLDTFHRFFERYERITGEDFYKIDAPTQRKDGDFDPNGEPVLAQIHQRRAAYLERMDDDFNTGAATSELFELVRVLNKFMADEKLEGNPTDAQIAALKQGARTLRELVLILGLFIEPPAADAGADDELVGQLVQLLIDIRANARKKKDFETSDQVRDQLAAMGIVLEDHKGETTWRRE